jgi:hypothetical protein
MRQVVVGLLKRRHAISVENGMTHPGTPDVNCTLGWAELKATENWPARPDTIVRLDHDMTPQQRVWHVRHRAAGGVSLVVLTIANEWLVFRGDVAAQHLGRVTREKLYEVAMAKWPRTPTTEELELCFQSQD